MAVTEGIPGGHAVLLRGDEGLPPLDQEAQDSESTCLPHQGIEMVDTRWPLVGAETRWEAAGDGSQHLREAVRTQWHRKLRGIRGNDCLCSQE